MLCNTEAVQAMGKQRKNKKGGKLEKYEQGLNLSWVEVAISANL